MVQFFNLPQKTQGRIGEEIGRGVGAGIGETLQEVAQYKRQRGRLQEALGQLEKLTPEDKKDPTRLLTTLLSATAGIPGSERYVGQLYDTMTRQFVSEAQRKTAEERKKTKKAPGAAPSPGAPVQPGMQPPGVGQAPTEEVTGEAAFLEPAAPVSPAGAFPKPTAGFETEPEMTYDEMQDYAAKQVEDSGGQITYNQGLQNAQVENAARRDRNDRLETQRQNRAAAIEQMSKAMVQRASDDNLLYFPGAKEVAANAAYAAREAETPEKQWEYVRSQLQEAENAYNGLVRQVGPEGPLGTAYRKAIGTYKEKDELFKDLQPYLKYYRERGLWDAARSTLSGELGLGAEDVETALFPPTEKERKFFDTFPQNPNAQKIKKLYIPHVGAIEKPGDYFPDERYKADEEGYKTLKGQIRTYLKENPNANLIALRGRLNQDKRWYWGDIKNAVQELADEKSFGTKSGLPNRAQQQQMLVIKQAPLPSLWQQFQYYWKGKK